MGSSSQTTADRDNLIRREILRLAILIDLAVAAFFLTRAVAASKRRNTGRLTWRLTNHLVSARVERSWDVSVYRFNQYLRCSPG